MSCARCGGFLTENWWDFVDEVEQRKLQGTRCVNCGAIDDPVILTNRLRPHRTRTIVPRGLISIGKQVGPGDGDRRYQTGASHGG